MLLELFDSTLAAANTVCRILGKDLLEEVASLHRKAFGNGDLFVQYVVHLVNEALFLACLEWVDPSKHLIEDETETVPVNRVTILTVADNLRRQVLGSPTEAFSSAIGVLKTAL